MDDLLAAYRSLLAEIDGWFDRCLARFPAAIRCAPGCCGCCRGLFDITLLDAALLQQGLSTLAPAEREAILAAANDRAAALTRQWPAFRPPYLLDGFPEAGQPQAWERNETPCLLLDAAGACRLYSFRPMTCRLHGVPNLDLAGEVRSEEWCTLNFPGIDPTALPELRWDFERIFAAETELLGAFSRRLLGRSRCSLGSIIPTALLLDLGRLAAAPELSWPDP